MHLKSVHGDLAIAGCALAALLTCATPSQAAAPAAPATKSTAPDLVLLHGTILTMAPQGLIAQAVAISGDRIVDVGTDARIKALAGPSTRVIDLEGKTVVPGFIDPRILGPFGFWETFGGVSLAAEGGRPAESPEEIQGAIQAWMKAHAPAAGSWIVAAGFNPRIATASRKLRRDFADKIAPDNPLLILSLDHRVALLNGKAIDAVGLQSISDEGGEIERDGASQPTGLVRETPVFQTMNKVWALLPETTRHDATTGFLSAAGRFGITTTGIPLAGAPDLATDQSLAQQGELSVRTVLQPLGLNPEASRSLQQFDHDRKSQDSDLLLVGAPMRVLDGTPIGGGAALFRPYSDARWSSGTLAMSPEGLDTLLSGWRLGQQGLSVQASGSLASHLLLDATEEAIRTPSPAGSARQVLRVDGLEMVSAHDRTRLPLLAKAGAVVSLQPSLFPFRIYMTNTIGEERMQEAMPYKSLVEAGVPIALSSGWPMTSQTFQPMQLIEWAVTRTGWRPEEALTVEQSLRASTYGAAQALGLEGRIGSIEIGKKADLVILSRNPLDSTMVPDALSDITVRMTLLGGSVVYEDRTGEVASRRPAPVVKSDGAGSF